jgi:hypothetical protein
MSSSASPLLTSTDGTSSTRKRKMASSPSRAVDAASAAPAQVSALTLPAIGLVSCENGDTCRHAYTWDHPEVFSFMIDAVAVSSKKAGSSKLLKSSRAFRTESFQMAGARFVMEVDVDARPFAKETSGSRVAIHMISPPSQLPVGQCLRVQLVCKRRLCDEQTSVVEECSCHAHTTRWAASGRWTVTPTQTKFTFDVDSFLSAEHTVQRYGHPVDEKDASKVQLRFEVVVLAGDACREVDVCSEYELLQAHEHAAGYACLAMHPPRRLESFGMFFEPRHSFLLCDDWDTQTVLREVKSSMALHHRSLDEAARLRAKKKQKKQKQRARKQQQQQQPPEPQQPQPASEPPAAAAALSTATPPARPARMVVVKKKPKAAFVASPELWMMNKATDAVVPAQYIPGNTEFTIGRVWATSELPIEPPLMFLRESTPLDDSPVLASALIHIKLFDAHKKTIVYIGSLSVQSLEVESLWLRLTQFVGWKQTGALPVPPNPTDALLQVRMPSRSMHWVKERCCFEETHLLTSGDTLIGFAMPDDPTEVIRTHQPLLMKLLRRASVRYSITCWSVTDSQTSDHAAYRGLESLHDCSGASTSSAKRSSTVVDFKSPSCGTKASLSRPIAALRTFDSKTCAFPSFEGFLKSFTNLSRATELMATLTQPFRPSLVQGLRADDDESDDESDGDDQEYSASEDDDEYNSDSNVSRDPDDSYDSLATTIQPSDDALSTADTEELSAEAPLNRHDDEENEDTSWIDATPDAPRADTKQGRRRQKKQQTKHKQSTRSSRQNDASAADHLGAAGGKEEGEEADAPKDVENHEEADEEDEELLPICKKVDLSFPRALPTPPVQLLDYEPVIQTAASKPRKRSALTGAPTNKAWSAGCMIRVASRDLLRHMLDQQLIGVRVDQRYMLDAPVSVSGTNTAEPFAVFLYAPAAAKWAEGGGVREGVLLGPFELDRSTLQVYRRHEAGAFPQSLVPTGFTLPVQCKIRPVNGGKLYWDLAEDRWRDFLTGKERHRTLDGNTVQTLAELLRCRGRTISAPLKQQQPPPQPRSRLPLARSPSDAPPKAAPVLPSAPVVVPLSPVRPAAELQQSDSVSAVVADQVPAEVEEDVVQAKMLHQPEQDEEEQATVPPLPRPVEESRGALGSSVSRCSLLDDDADTDDANTDDADTIIVQDLAEINRRRFFSCSSDLYA